MATEDRRPLASPSRRSRCVDNGRYASELPLVRAPRSEAFQHFRAGAEVVPKRLLVGGLQSLGTCELAPWPRRNRPNSRVSAAR